MVKPLWKTFWQVFIKLSVHSLRDLAMPLLTIYPNEMKTYVYLKA